MSRVLCLLPGGFSANLFPEQPGEGLFAFGLQDFFGVDATENIHYEGDRARPPSLVAGSQPGSVIAVEELVEKDEVAPMHILLKLLRPSVNWPPAARVA